jgi:hypothetical protein
VTKLQTIPAAGDQPVLSDRTDRPTWGEPLRLGGGDADDETTAQGTGIRIACVDEPRGDRHPG